MKSNVQLQSKGGDNYEIAAPRNKFAAFLATNSRAGTLMDKIPQEHSHPARIDWRNDEL